MLYRFDVNIVIIVTVMNEYDFELSIIFVAIAIDCFRSIVD